MSYMDLSKKVEESLQATITALALSGVAVLTGTDDATKSVPNVICACESIGPEDPYGSGNFNASARVTVNSNAKDTTLAAHRTRVAAVFDEMRQDDLAATLAANATDFHVFGATCDGMGTDNNELNYSDWISLNLYCCATDVTA